MATYVLIPGAASDHRYWYLVVPELEALGHDVVAVDLPNTDDKAGFVEYADAVVEAIGDRSDVILVAQSMGGFTAPLVAARVPVDLIVLVAAMIPAAGEAPAEWQANTGSEAARVAAAEREGRPATFDPNEVFFHDVAPDVVAVLSEDELGQSDTPFSAPYPFAGWSGVPVRFVLPRDDRMFPADLQRRLVRERLGIEPDEIEGGHLVAVSRPAELVRLIESFRTEG